MPSPPSTLPELLDLVRKSGTHPPDAPDRWAEADGPIPYPRAAGYVAQAARGLHHAHERGFIHRDVKPSNLILTADGTVKVLDLGLARPADDGDHLTRNLDGNAVVGTADYIA